MYSYYFHKFHKCILFVSSCGAQHQGDSWVIFKFASSLNSTRSSRALHQRTMYVLLCFTNSGSRLPRGEPYCYKEGAKYIKTISWYNRYIWHKQNKILPWGNKTVTCKSFVFNTIRGITDEHVGHATVSDKKAETICSVLMRTLESLSFKTKWEPFVEDNCHTSFGGVNSTGTNNVFQHLKNSL